MKWCSQFHTFLNLDCSDIGDPGAFPPGFSRASRSESSLTASYVSTLGSVREVLELLGTIGQTDAELQTAKNAIARGLQLHFLLDPGQVPGGATLRKGNS